MTDYFKKDGDKFVLVEDKLLAQEDVDGIIEKRLERERAKFADYPDLKEKAGKVDTLKSEYEEKLKSAGTEKSELEGKLKSATLETVKVKAIHQFKLKPELSEFINGDDEDTILSQAEKLSKGVGGSDVIIDKTPKPDDKNKKASSSAEVAKGLFGPGKSDD